MSKKVAYVTGGMGGIGTSLCQRLHKDGFTVIAGCGPSRDFKKWLDEQSALGFGFYASVGNVSDWDSTVAAFKAVREQHGVVGVLVNNAGITRDGMFRKMSRDDWAAVIDTNLNSLFNVTKQVIDEMTDAGWGRIINISSVNGEKGQFGQTNQLFGGQGRHARLHQGRGARVREEGRDCQHDLAGLHRHEDGDGDPDRGARVEDHSADSDGAPGQAGGSRGAGCVPVVG